MAKSTAATPTTRTRPFRLWRSMRVVSSPPDGMLCVWGCLTQLITRAKPLCEALDAARVGGLCAWPWECVA